MVSVHSLLDASVVDVVVACCICVLLCMEFVESASSDDDFIVVISALSTFLVPPAINKFTSPADLLVWFLCLNFL